MEGWVKVHLDDVVHLLMGQSPNSSYYNTENFGVKFLQGCAEFGEKYPHTEIYCSQPHKIAPPNSILFSVRAPVGRINFADREYCIGRGLASIIPKNIDLDFLFQYLSFINSQFQSITQGSTFESINSKQLKGIELIVPELQSEQTQIAAILSTVDKAIEQTEALIAKYRRIKTGLMQNLLTKGIDEHSNIRSEETHAFKDSPLGRIPVEWEVKRLSEIVYQSSGFIQTGPFGSQLHAEEYVAEGVPVIMPQDLVDGKISLEKIARINEEKAQILKRHKVKPNDIVFARRGELSRCLAIEKEHSGWICGTGCMLLRPPKEQLIAKWFVEIYRNHLSQKQILSQAVGTTMVNLNTTLLENLLIAKPELNEQTQIIEILGELDTLIDQEQKNCSKLQKIKTGLMQDLLTGKVRVSEGKMPETTLEEEIKK